MPQRQRLWFAGTLLLSAVGVLGAAWACSRLGAFWQAAHAEQNYCLIPVNLMRFWFLPLLSLAALVLGRVAQRPSGWYSVAAVAALVFTLWQFAYWAGVAAKVGRHPDHPGFAVATGGDFAVPLAAACVRLLAWVALALGVWESLRDSPPSSMPSRNGNAG